MREGQVLAWYMIINASSRKIGPTFECQSVSTMRRRFWTPAVKSGLIAISIANVCRRFQRRKRNLKRNICLNSQPMIFLVFLWKPACWNLYIYIYIYIYMSIDYRYISLFLSLSLYIYIYIERERYIYMEAVYRCLLPIDLTPARSR